MKNNKKIAIMLGMALIAIPHACKAALDAEGNNLVNDIKIAYGTSMGPAQILNPEMSLSSWIGVLAKVNSYVKKNSTVAGIADRDLVEALTGVLNANSRLITAIGSIVRDCSKEICGAKDLKRHYLQQRVNYNTSRTNTPMNLVNDRRTLSLEIARYRGGLAERIEQLKDIRMRLNTTKAQLAAATFRFTGVSNRENAREILLTVIDYVQRAITTAINKINTELEPLKMDEGCMEVGRPLDCK